VAKLRYRATLVPHALSQFIAVTRQRRDQIVALDACHSQTEGVNRLANVLGLSRTCLHSGLDVVDVDVDTVESVT